MPKLRQDPTTKEWVIFATERAKRPDDFRTPDPGADHQTSPCPFCPGNEAATPPAVLTLSDQDSSAWSVRVVPNKFAALAPGTASKPKQIGTLYHEMDGVGAHEVIVDTPKHDTHLALLTEPEVFDVLRAYRERFQSLSKKPGVKLIMIFKNHGSSAGTSLEHPHSQLLATPVLPRDITQKLELARNYHETTGGCLYCDIVREERALRSRLVLETKRFIVFHPFASKWPFETWIAPKNHQSVFANVSEDDLEELAQVLRQSLLKLFIALGNPDYNYILHSAPAEDEQNDYYLWHLQIIPRLTTAAGFELGSGMAINTALPEETAKFLKEAN